MNLERGNEERRKKDQATIERLINQRLANGMDAIVARWIDYEPEVYVSVSVVTTLENSTTLNQYATPSIMTKYVSAYLNGVTISTTRGDTKSDSHLLASRVDEVGALIEVVLLTDTTTFTVPVDKELLRDRLHARIATIDAELARLPLLDRTELQIQRDQLMRRLELVSL